MHHVIRLIVYAPTKEEALEKAKQVFEERLCPTPFDYGTFFDEEDNTVSGKARWGNLPPVESINSKAGKHLIDDGFKAIKQDFDENIKTLRSMISKFNDEELFEGKIIDENKEILKELEEKKDMDLDQPYWFSHVCWRISRGDWLFDNDGEAIKDSKDLKRVLSMEYNDNKKNKAWVIPVDVHT